MRVLRCLFVLVFVLLIGGSASAQEAKGWLGADVQDVTKAEADKLKWDAPHGAKVGVVASGSPAEKAGLRSGDIILSIDRMVIDTSSEANAAVAAKRPGDAILLQVLSNGNEHRVNVTIAEQPKIQAVQDQGGPQLMLDTGGHTALIVDLAFTPDGKQLVSASDDKVIRVWDWQVGKTVRTIRGQVAPGPEGRIFATALSPDGRWLAVGGWIKVPGEQGHVIRLYDFASAQLVALLKGHINIVGRLAFSLDGKRLISGGADNSAIIWDVEGRKLIHRLRGHTAEVYGVAFTPDGERVVTGSNDNTLRLWRVADGGMIAELKGHTKKIWSALAVRSSDGMIASGDETGEIRLWGGNTGQYLRTLASQGGQIGRLRFSPDGARLLSTTSYCESCKRIQHVWEVATGKELFAYSGHDNTVIAAAISPEGKYAATGGGELYPVHVWDLKTGETKQTLVGTGARGWAVGFSANGRRIAWGTNWQSATSRRSHTLRIGTKPRSSAL